LHLIIGKQQLILKQAIYIIILAFYLK